MWALQGGFCRDSPGAPEVFPLSISLLQHSVDSSGGKRTKRKTLLLSESFHSSSARSELKQITNLPGPLILAQLQ